MPRRNSGLQVAMTTQSPGYGNLFEVASNVYAIRFIPVALKSLSAFAVALLLPFVPVVFLAIPTETILQSLKKLLF